MANDSLDMCPIVYTILEESCYLVFEQVPAYHLEQDLLRQCRLIGQVTGHEQLKDHPATSKLVDAFLIKLESVAVARKVKRKLDDSIFYGGQIRVHYAPERETVEDTRSKLNERQIAVTRHLQPVRLRSEPTRAMDIKTLPVGEMNDAIGPRVYPSSSHVLPQQPKRRRRI
ncbi:hypothetical protein INT43_004748 [Umbelopsis isabellina]|uniref:Uncharacterized protein n=1 Tax=Mortierella isabellina TaxID=91625 RepID=A0A8H7U8L1_MORIS|nr:hypothetical protein INT43_004748 [Umbelopsis isabellina]